MPEATESSPPNAGSRPMLMRFLGYLLQNAFTKLGAILATSSGISLVFFWTVELFSHRSVHPYMGILLFLVMPGLFVAGLLLIPFGAYWRRRKLLKQGEVATAIPLPDLASPTFRRSATFILGLTVLNIFLVGVSAYRGIEYMDSTQFCGLTCHSVMEPEHTAFLDSPHARVGCVGCHIGPGAGWFVKSKLSGVRQLWAVNAGTYSRPIPVPVQNLRPARDTCEQCHWPEKFHGNKVVVKTHYDNDEANTVRKTVLMMRIGGRSKDRVEGIHGRHLNAATPIEYVPSDETRKVIPVVYYGTAPGQQEAFVAADAAPTKQARRTMDCIDCHSRPAHKMQSPETVMDLALQEGRISTSIPFIHKQGVEILKSVKGDRVSAPAQIAAALEAYYKQNHPDFYRDKKPLLSEAIHAIQTGWLRNVYPRMRITWGTYPEQIGHEEATGCFRCHDGSHQTTSGKTISGDCDTCHSILAQAESDPKVIKDLGLK